MLNARSHANSCAFESPAQRVDRVPARGYTTRRVAPIEGPALHPARCHHGSRAESCHARCAAPGDASGTRRAGSCASGARANRAVAIAKKLGYDNAQAMAGGLKAWREASLPVEKA